MKFEFDKRKSEKTKKERGIDFQEIQVLWEDDNLLEIPAKTVFDEIRYVVIGKIGETHWSSVITYRKEKIRIISVRRSKTKEIEAYEG